MPVKGYTNLTVRVDVRNRLEELRSTLGFGSFSDLLVFLMKVYEDYKELSIKLDRILAALYRLGAFKEPNP